MVMVPGTSHCHGGFTCQLTWALAPPCTYRQAFAWEAVPAAKASLWALKKWLPLIHSIEGQAGLEAWGCGFAPTEHWLSASKGTGRVIRQLGRPEAFIISKVTAFSKSNSSRKWTAAMGAAHKGPRNSFCLSPGPRSSATHHPPSHTYRTVLAFKSHTYTQGTSLIKAIWSHYICIERGNTLWYR